MLNFACWINVKKFPFFSPAMQLAAHTAARWIGGLSKPQEGFSLHAAEKEDLINAAKTLLK